MAIVKCPKCRKRYDPGTEDLDDMPDNMSQKVVCPGCGQWARLPAGEAIPTPKLPPAMLKSIKAQARLLDDDEEEEDRPTRSSSPIITCPKCEKQFKGKGNLAGKKIRCPFCKEPFTVPETEEEPASKPAAKKPAAKPAAKAPAAKKSMADDDDDDNPNPYGVTKLDLAPRCPNCANEMQSEEAVICLFCGYNTLTRTWGKTEKVIAMTGSEHFLWLLPGLICVTTILLLIVFLIVYCLVLPYYSQGQWYEFSDHESMHMWFSAIFLSVMWGLGYFAFSRLVLNPKPPDKVKD